MSKFYGLMKKFDWLGMTLSFLTVLSMCPNPYHTVPELDSSWQVVLEHAFFNQWQFGKDIIFTGGPLSFLYTPTSIGHIPKLQVLLEATVLFLAVHSVMMAIRNEAILLRILAFFVLICGAHTSKDGIYLISISAVGFSIIRQGKTDAVVYFYISLIALLGLMKFTFALLGITTIAVAAAYKITNGHLKGGLATIGIYVLTFILIWALIGQEIQNIPTFFRYSWSLAQGYTWGMHLLEPLEMTKFPFFIFVITSVPIFIWSVVGKQPRNWSVFIIASLGIFVSWKTGITRFGVHIFFFIQVAALISILVATFVKTKKYAYGWVSCCMILFLASNFLFLPTDSNTLLRRIKNQATFGLKFIASGGNEVNKFSEFIPRVKAAHTLPKIKEKVGTQTIDVLYYHHGILLLNELNYAPRPTVQNYPAYNENLAKWNAQHLLQNPPQFILCKDGEIDSRHPTVADSYFLRKVFENYSPVLEEKEWLLLERNKNPSPFREFVTINKRKVKDGERIDLTELNKKNLWLRIDYQPSILHQVASFLYKPEILLIEVSFESQDPQFFRLIGKNLRSGFLLSPTLDSMESLKSFLRGGEISDRIKSFSIHSSTGWTPFATKEFQLEIVELSQE